MDDYSVTSLVESKNEWCARLITILTPALIVGIKSIFDEAIKLYNEALKLDEKNPIIFYSLSLGKELYCKVL